MLHDVVQHDDVVVLQRHALLVDQRHVLDVLLHDVVLGHGVNEVVLGHDVDEVQDDVVLLDVVLHDVVQHGVLLLQGRVLLVDQRHVLGVLLHDAVDAVLGHDVVRALVNHPPQSRVGGVCRLDHARVAAVDLRRLAVLVLQRLRAISVTQLGYNVGQHVGFAAGLPQHVLHNPRRRALVDAAHRRHVLHLHVDGVDLQRRSPVTLHCAQIN